MTKTPDETTGKTTVTLFGDAMLDDIILNYDDDMDQLFVVMNTLFNISLQTRQIKWQHKRLNWHEHVRMCRHTNRFETRYHMKEQLFVKLPAILRPKLTIDEAQSMQSTSGNSPITPEMTLAIGLRFLGGEYQKSLANIFVISILSTQRVVNNFLDAVQEKLAISIPKTTVELL